MQIETKFLWLFRAVELGQDLNGWEVCWLGGWDRCRVMFIVMVKRVTPGMKHPADFGPKP
jgi:hypothetical protein